MRLRTWCFFGPWLAAALIGSTPLRAGTIIGAEIHPLNFFILPSGTGLSTNANFGSGAVFAGLSAGGYFDFQAYLSHDNTGTFKGTGALFGQTGSFDGKFKVLSYGIEMKFTAPAFPIYLKAGIGLCDLTSEVTYNVAGVPVADPFSSFEAAFEAHGGLGLSLKLAVVRLHAGIDAVVVKIKESSAPLANLSAFVYFRPQVGLSLLF